MGVVSLDLSYLNVTTPITKIALNYATLEHRADLRDTYLYIQMARGTNCKIQWITPVGKRMWS